IAASLGRIEAALAAGPEPELAERLKAARDHHLSLANAPR
ncbi:MAG: hypothetical protein FD126_1737, partial [Elusimicrobia bacterium]